MFTIRFSQRVEITQSFCQHQFSEVGLGTVDHAPLSPKVHAPVVYFAQRLNALPSFALKRPCEA